MGYFDDIVPPDSAPSYVATPSGVPRITVRPKRVDPATEPEDASQNPAGASDDTDAAPVRRRFFDDIVSPAGPEHALQNSADAPDDTYNAAPARSGGFFDDIVPPVGAPASGGQFAAPLPGGRNFRVTREGTSPPAGFADRLAAMWENPPKDRLSLIGLIKSTYEGATLPGDVVSGKTPIMGPDGHTNDEVISRAKDLAQAYPLQSAPGGVFGRAVNGRLPNPLAKVDEALSDEAMVPRGTITPTVAPAPSRQVLAEVSEQGMPNSRAGPRPPAKPPDKALPGDRGQPPDRLDAAKTTTEPRPQGGVFDSGGPNRRAAEPEPASAAATGKFYSVAFEMKLKLSSLRRSRQHHFQKANEALLREMESDPQFAEAMQQLGITLKRTRWGRAPRTSPAGWTWHHAQEPGVMQLVPRSQHDPGTIFQGVLHPKGRGGYSKWGK